MKRSIPVFENFTADAVVYAKDFTNIAVVNTSIDGADILVNEMRVRAGQTFSINQQHEDITIDINFIIRAAEPGTEIEYTVIKEYYK